jgi:hypothetical protein
LKAMCGAYLIVWLEYAKLLPILPDVFKV